MRPAARNRTNARVAPCAEEATASVPLGITPLPEGQNAPSRVVSFHLQQQNTCRSFVV